MASDLELAALAYFDKKDFASARKNFEKLLDYSEAQSDDVRADCLFNVASCMASEGNHQAALDMFESLQPTSNDLIYSKALCLYKLADYESSLKLLDKLLSKSLGRSLELSPAQAPQNFKDPLQYFESSCLIEAINLKYTILFRLDEEDASLERGFAGDLSFMKMESLDCVSLHNRAVLAYRSNVALSVDMLAHLVDLSTHPDFKNLVPVEAIKNLILVCSRVSSLGPLGQKLLNENRDKLLDLSQLSHDELDYLDILVCQQADGHELQYRKLDHLSDHLLANCAKLEASSDKQKVMDHPLSLLISSIVSRQGFLLWANSHYRSLYRLLMKFQSNLLNTDIWMINMASTLLMLDEQMDYVAQLYEALMPKSVSDNLLLVEPMTLANLCVAYVLTGRNSEAEALIKEVELDDSKFRKTSQSSLIAGPLDSNWNFQPHITVINLVIGVLYCARNNFEFGLPRVLRSLQPIEQKLNSATWFHAKRCILSLVASHSKQMICIKDEIFDEIINFLIDCEKSGVSKEASEMDLFDDKNYGPNIENSISIEARYLRSILLAIVHD